MYSLCIAEDEYYVQKSIENRVRGMNLGFDVLGCAYTGIEAEELYERFHPDVFFVDIQMPQCSGMEFIEKIREQDPDCRTLFIIISGYSDYRNMHRAIKADVFDYLEKPIVPDEFGDMLKRAICELQRLAGEEEKRKTNQEETQDVSFQISYENMEEETNRVRQIQEYIRQHYKEDLNTAVLGEAFFLSSSYLSHEFKRKTGVSPGKYLEEVRLQQAERLLRKTDQMVSMVAENVGYTDQNYFTKVFRKRYGKTPTEYRKNS